MRTVSILLALLAFVFAPALAVAQPAKPSDNTVARADALFEEAQALLGTDLNAACAKFAESYELNPHALGTLLNVARCDEKLGRIASAHEKFKLARDIAAEQLASGSKDVAAHKKAAITHIDALEKRIPHVTIELVPPILPDITIVVDGKAHAKDKLATLPVDPGSHTIVVSAPGYQSQEVSFAIAEGEHHTVAVPRLEKSVTVGRSRRTIGIIVGGSGAVVGLTGIVVGLVARSRYNDTTSCHADGSCDLPEDYTRRNNARSLGNVGTVVGAAGGIALVVGGVLWYTGRRTTESRSRVTFVPHVSAEAAGITAAGRF